MTTPSDEGPLYPFDDDPPPRGWPRPSGELVGAVWSQTTAAHRRPPRRPRGETEFQRRKRLRDLVILLCHRSGLSQREIATVFDISKSQVGVILDSLVASTGPQDQDS